MNRPLFRILCPRNTLTGGPEALHQLCAALVEAGHDAAIHYLPHRASNTCPHKYRHYGAPVVHELPDLPQVVVIIPEVMTDIVWRLHKAQLLVWWLSVDFYLFRPTKWTKRAKRWLRELLPQYRPYAFQPHPRLQHAAHGQYTRSFLARHGVCNPCSLTEYIAPALTVPEDEVPAGPRRDICLYNPRKGHAFTQQIVAACSGNGIEFVPLIGYSESALRELYAQAKLYIDFGGHPGRERMPREAAASGCVVVTGSRGSAGNDVDVPLRPPYKMDDDDPELLPTLRRRLADMAADYPLHRAAQAPYRAWIRSQRDVFHAEAAALGAAYAAAMQPRPCVDTTNAAAAEVLV